RDADPFRATAFCALASLEALCKSQAIDPAVQWLVSRGLALVSCKDQGGRLRFGIQREVLTIGAVKPDGYSVYGREIIAATLGGLRTGRPHQEQTEMFSPSVCLLTPSMTLGRALQFQIEFIHNFVLIRDVRFVHCSKAPIGNKKVIATGVTNYDRSAAVDVAEAAWLRRIRVTTGHRPG